MDRWTRSYQAGLVITPGSQTMHPQCHLRKLWASNTQTLRNWARNSQGHCLCYYCFGLGKVLLTSSGIRHSQWTCPFSVKDWFPVYCFSSAWVGSQVEILLLGFEPVNSRFIVKCFSFWATLSPLRKDTHTTMMFPVICFLFPQSTRVFCVFVCVCVCVCMRVFVCVCVCVCVCMLTCTRL